MFEICKKLLDWIKKSRINRILIVAIIFSTLFRIYLAVKTPLYAQAGADFDDYLFVKYALSILSGGWLGPFDCKTLAKGASYSVFLAVNYLLGIPYSLELILTYITAVILFIIAIRKLISNKYFLLTSYLFLLFSPVMFHIENVQKIYRGGLIVSFALIIISAAIGLYTSRNDSRKTQLKWSLLLGFSLSFFWFLKEDSIWILPFVLGIILITIISSILQRKKIISRIFISIIPIILLFSSILLYSYTNYKFYGEFTITDRSGTYFKEFIADILQIEDDENYQNVWITKKMMYKAIDVSPTLQSIKPYIDDMYKNSWALKENGEIEGDMIYWIIKEKVSDAGIYDKGGEYVNKFYQKIDTELNSAFKTGKLKKSKDKIYLSSMAKGFTINEIEKFNKKETKSAIDTIITYKENETSIYEATGDYNNILNMQYLTNSTIILPGTGKKKLEFINVIVNIDTKIVEIYQKTGNLVFSISIIGLILLIIEAIYNFVTKKNNKYYEIALILICLCSSATALFIGVEWFCSWFGFFKNRYIYNYTCGIFPILQILESIGIYILFINIINIFRQITNKYLQRKKNNIKLKQGE